LDVDERLVCANDFVIRTTEIARAYRAYQKMLLESDSFDFGDLISYTIKLLKERPSILQKYRHQFKYILVDEFQDTNTAQYQLIKMLVNKKRNLTVVGDDDQSIYRFRGASIGNIMRFKDDFPDAVETVLNENYRSCQEILDLSHRFIIQNNPYRLEEKLGINKALKAQKEGVAEIQHFHAIDLVEEAQIVAGKILDLKDQNPEASWSDFAILVRANDTALPFISALQNTGIPYQFMALSGLYSTPIIVDLLSYAKLLDNYHESTSAYRVLGFSCWGILTEDLVKIAHEARKKAKSIYEIMKTVSSVPGLDELSVAKVLKIVSWIEKHTCLAQEKKPIEVLTHFLYDSGYLEGVNKQAPAEMKENLDYLQQFFKKVKSEEIASPSLRLKEFMAIINMEMEAGDAGKLMVDVEAGPELVKIMTVHKAKGLEFDYVFIPSLVDRKFPSDERPEQIPLPATLFSDIDDDDALHIREERRLFYVAMTRARKGLYFSSGEDYGGIRSKKLSRFLNELGYNAPISEKKESLIKVAEEQAEVLLGDFFPKKFSFSQMATYEKCPLLYKYANILKIPVFGGPAQTFGQVIHSTLQEFLSQCFAISEAFQVDLLNVQKQAETKVLPIEKLYEIYASKWSDDWYQSEAQKEEYRKKGFGMLKNFYQDFTATKPKVKFLELPFSFKLGEYKFSGRIDRVDESMDGNVRIVDYKTGELKNEKLSTDDRRQLLFYQIAAEEGLNLRVGQLAYYYLSENKQLPFIGKESEKEKLKVRFLAIIEDIKAGKFEANPNQFSCAYCDYRHICEKRKI